VPGDYAPNGFEPARVRRVGLTYMTAHPFSSFPNVAFLDEYPLKPMKAAKDLSCSLMNQFTFVDLFAGIGGFHHALERLGGECVLAVEKDPACQLVYRASFPGTPLIGDIRTITRDDNDLESSIAQIRKLVPPHDVLTAGFPCQPFSKSGFQHGTRDKTRGTLFHDIMSIVIARKPEFVLLENVRNLAGPRHRETWLLIIRSLREEGYIVAEEPIILSPHQFSKSKGGRPQVRERVFIAAYRPRGNRVAEELTVRHLMPDSARIPTWNIEDLLQDDKSIQGLERFRLSSDEKSWIDAWQNFVEIVPDDNLPGFPIWIDYFTDRFRSRREFPVWKNDFVRKNHAFYTTSPKRRRALDQWMKRRWGHEKRTILEFPQSRRKFEWQARSVQPTRGERDLSQLVIQFRPSGIRVKPATYLPALVAVTQTSVIGGRMRRITPLEAARLQGFPDKVFRGEGVPLAKSYRQLGNAVNVGVARIVAESLFRIANQE
jgi:DNA (cytosine-5)-methyltransferase 1